MKSLRAMTLVLFLLVATAIGRAQDGILPAERLDRLVSVALANNPELNSSQSRWQMFVNRARQAGSLDDPMLMFSLQNMLVRKPLVFDRDPQSAKVVGISQQLPFWGKRDLRREMADYEAESYRWSLEERRLELTRMVKQTYYQLWAADRFLGIIDKNLRVLGDFVTIAETKYAVGQGVQQDIYKAGLEKSRMLEMRITLRQQRLSLEANLNYLLSRSADTPVGPIPDFSLPHLTRSAEQLNAIAFETRPQLKSLALLVKKGEAGQRLAEKEYYPDFNLSAEYMFKEKMSTAMGSDPGYDMFSLGLSFNLPFQREKRRAMQAESLSETRMATEELNALKNGISFIITDTLAQMERRRTLIELYRSGIIPQAEQSLESAVIGYRVNKVDFMTLLDGRMTLFTYERELYESQAEYMMKLAQLEATVGTELEH